MTTNKEFDCIEFKRLAQQKIYGQIAGLSPAEEIAWFRRRVAEGPFGDWVARLSDRRNEVMTCHEPVDGYGEEKD